MFFGLFNVVIVIVCVYVLYVVQVDWFMLEFKLCVMVCFIGVVVDVYFVIGQLLVVLGDYYSYLQLVVIVQKLEYGGFVFLLLKVQVLFGQFGYIDMFGYSGMQVVVWWVFVNGVIGDIICVQLQVCCGWVVDLCYNFGGSMLFMFVSLCLLLGEGVLGGFCNVQGQVYLLYVVSLFDLDLFKGLVLEYVCVVVLQGLCIVSFGEVVVIVFCGWFDMCLFGQFIVGLSIGNVGFCLFDGSEIFFIILVDVDCIGCVYGECIVFD